MNKTFFQLNIKLLCVFLLMQIFSCTKKDTQVNEAHHNSILQTDHKNDNLKEEDNDIVRLDDELEGEDEFISEKLLQQWKGKYSKEYDVTDGWGRESISYAELDIIKPDSCIFKGWLTNTNGIRYIKDDGYFEYIGGIYATVNKDSIEFFTKRVIEGGNEDLSPLLTLIKRKNEYFISSFITSPTHNGIIEMPLQKIK